VERRDADRLGRKQTGPEHAGVISHILERRVPRSMVTVLLWGILRPRLKLMAKEPSWVGLPPAP